MPVRDRLVSIDPSQGSLPSAAGVSDGGTSALTGSIMESIGDAGLLPARTGRVRRQGGRLFALTGALASAAVALAACTTTEIKTVKAPDYASQIREVLIVDSLKSDLDLSRVFRQQLPLYLARCSVKSTRIDREARPVGTAVMPETYVIPAGSHINAILLVSQSECVGSWTTASASYVVELKDRATSRTVWKASVALKSGGGNVYAADINPGEMLARDVTARLAQDGLLPPCRST